MFYSYIKLFPFRFSVLFHNMCVRIPFHVLKLMDLLTYSLSPTGTYIPCVRIHLLSLCRDSPTFLVSGFTYFPCVRIHLLSLCQDSPTFLVSGITYFPLCQDSLYLQVQARYPGDQPRGGAQQGQAGGEGGGGRLLKNKLTGANFHKIWSKYSVMRII